ncbi:MAG: chromosome segregation protein SMC, partial [Chloroflexi bacterium]
ERLEAAEAQLSAIEAASAATRARHAELDDALQRVERETLDRTRARAAAAGAQAAYTDRLRALEQERAAVGDQRSRDMQVRDETQAALDALETRRAQLHAQIGALEATVAGQSAEEAELRARFSEQEQALAAAERELAALQTRLEALERTHLAGEGLYAGVRAVLRAVRQGRLTLPGLLGPLGELIAVPPDLETAIEVALGGHLQDIVVASWADADAAIAFLKRDGAGRATFQPLETVRMPRSQRLDLQDPGIVGIAADLIGHDPRIAAVVANTLGRVLVVDDLDATRRVLGSAPGWTIVTRTGELTRPGGSITGGSRVAEAGMLARERERRGLPGRIAARKAALAKTSAARDDVARQQAARAEELAVAKAQLERVRQEERGVAGEQARLERDLATVLTALARHDARARDIGQRLGALHDEQAEQQSHLAALDTRLAELAEERERIRQALAALPPVDPAGSATLRAEIAGLRERSSSAAQALARARARGASAERAQAARAAEIAHIEATLAAARRELGDVLDAIALQADAIESARAGLPPLEQERADVALRVAAGERALDDATARVRDAERERDRASLGLARAQDEQVFLAERIRNDLDLDDPDALHDDASGDAAATDPAATEAEVQRLRERLRRMAVVGDDVLEQYEAEAARLAHLSEQLRDVEEAAAGLRSVLAQLHGKMAERFDATFREVGAAFERTFVRLFGGGTARLALHTGDDGTTSIDIIAQPPGKRISGLAALSGGERALTAVALLLAIQRVNPSPFCLLDEVDAALDESNVLRFRDELRDLSGSTQFIVITHNRGTIEGADTLYGVTMGEDSVSRVISLRLEDAVRQVEEREMAEAAGG